MSATVKQIVVEKILAGPGAPTVTAGGMLAPTSGAVVAQGTSGATSVSYKLVSVAASGARSLATGALTVADANATQTSVNKNHITWVDDPACHHVEVYRTAGGADQGYIGSVLAGVQVFNDTGIAKAVSPILPVATTRKYKIVSLGTDNPSGTHRQSAAGAEGTSAVGPETLTADTPMTVDWTAVTSAQGYQVYRTDALVTKGLIGSTDAATSILSDTGVVGDGNDPPTTDGTGISIPCDVRDLGDKYLQIGGTFVATLQVQGTINGVDWKDEGAAIVAVGIVAIAPSYALLRIKETAFTSGAPTAHLAGRRVAG